MKSISFVKMHGLGNDFILLDGIKNKLPRIRLDRFAVNICDRTTGIGADGLIIVLPSRRHDFRMRIINSDGGEAEMCGNGFRCLIRYVFEKGYTRKREIDADTIAGKITGRIVSDKLTDFRVRVAMGRPEFRTDVIGMKTSRKEIIESKISILGGQYAITAVAIGNPHAVIFVMNWNFDWKAVGHKIEYHRLFPARTNVEFARIMGRKKLAVRSWERGAGATLASGTGSCAAVAAGIRTGRLANSAEVILKMGSLFIEQDHDSGQIYKTGPAEYICEGRYFY